MEDLPALVASKNVMARRHPTEPLTIYNYSAKTQIEKAWNETTLTTRGLIMHDDGTVVARPYRKFFNAGEHPDHPVPPVFEVFDKADGSLGISYRVPSTGRIAISSRGSFDSPQAIRATQMWREKYDHIDIPLGETWLFEIVGLWNRIVLKYSFDDLILHGCIDIKTGADLPLPSSWPGPVIQSFPAMPPAELKALVRENAEGFVLREHPVPTDRPARRIKVKFDEYERMHKLISGCTPHAIWGALSRGEPLSALLDGMPDEFYRDALLTAEKLTARVTIMCSEARVRFQQVLADTPWGDRKARAMRIQKEPEEHRAALYALLSNKPVEPLAWKHYEPAGGEGPLE